MSGTPIWTARQTVCFSPPGCPSGYVNLPSRNNLPLPVRQYSLPHIVARQWGRVSSPTTLAMSLCHSGNAPFAHMRKRCKASCSDPPSRPRTFLQLAMCCLCHVFLGRSSTVLDAVPNAIALFSLHSSSDVSGRPFCSVPSDTTTEESPSMSGTVLAPSSSFFRAAVGLARNTISEVSTLHPVVHLLLKCITSINPDPLSNPALARRLIAICSDAAGRWRASTTTVFSPSTRCHNRLPHSAWCARIHGLKRVLIHVEPRSE